MLIALLLVVLIVAPSIFLFTNIFYSTYESMAKNQLDRGISAGRMFLDSIMSTTDNLALNQQLIETLDGTRSGSLAPLLDSTCTYSLDIAAITVYGENGAVYTSSGVTNPPGAAELASLADIAEFFADEDADEYVSLRTSAIIKAYDNAPYDARAGIISYCRKVYAEDGSVLGCIFADIFPHELFERFNMTDGGADGYKPAKEYRPYKGFVIGAVASLIPVIFVIVDVTAHSTGARLAYSMIAGWAFWPVFNTSTSAHILFTLIPCAVMVVVSGVAYILGSNKEKLRQFALKQREEEVAKAKSKGAKKR